ncbi:ATP-binding protein of ABC transporter system [Bifidobacterium pseudolongum subsp. globosum]|uniref:ATP-binding protein of ABC transporter system n=1 Tax=Bifidobacterium pseudolongum subsp. globosum TaxID=1690 RepID=A0A2N3QYQ6_9BIFI|nr:ABC-F family ATP-binding cassette domain-containing protein [Bifidobacterium pseudolongum]PKU98323.1 ATP-binding protein of ABC transporter system [Bifidobacterium pseudolongum subsp. globosum]PKV06448.1 ATP-binding protein of ABC transporter system [Bifidobacterium pseudolongum subsp. globosum]RYQ02589.1 ATP-binding protein of ABC transporter system [Bifidobacterium pseudolongum subsp. globosum]RYQ76268.1 ATP-binding protein of ABC transporter system [Bifidobacterium pseudolongum subsp. glo
MPTYDLGLEHVSLAFATKTVFTDVTQGVFEGDRIGIVGRNGDGKSTLLKLLDGTQEPDSGRVTRRNGLTFGMLTQRDALDDNATLREAALEGREDYEWASQQQSREIVEALLGGMNLDAKIGSLSGGQRRRADLARLLLKDWDILALDEPTNHLDVITIHWLAEHLKNRWSRSTGALLLVTHDRWFLDEVCESMWEVHDGQIEPFEGGYSAYMLQRVERDRQADVRETKRRNLARKELAWLSRGARARSTKQKFHVKAATELIADVPPMRNTLELKQMATARLGKQVVDLVDVTQVYDREQGAYADIDPDAAALAASARSASTVDVVEPMVQEPQVFGSVTIAVDDADDPRLASAFGARAGEVAAEHGLTHHEPAGEINALRGTRGDADAEETSAAVEITVSGRKILDDVTWLIGPGDRFGIVGANGAGKSTLLKILDGTLTPTAGRVNIGKTVRFAVLSQRLDELEKLGKYKVKEVLSRYKPSYIVDGKEVTPGQLMERLGFEAAQLMTPIRDLSGGQKRRMQLLLILLDEPNVLIMDEPGNDLDTDMLAVMEDLLDTWPGTLIVVSHDRYLLERVTDEQFALIGGKVRHLPGGVQDYLDMVEQLKRGEDPLGLKGAADAPVTGGDSPANGGGSADAASAGTTTEPEAPKLSGKAYADASRRVSAIERKLEKIATQKEQLEAQMAAHDPSDYAGLNELNGQLQALAAESDGLEAEWLDLSEQMGQ